MPFINGRYYMNPQYGAAMQRGSRRTDGTFAAIAKSVETGSTRPLEKYLWGGTDPSAQPDEPSHMLPVPRTGIVPVAELYANRRDGYAHGPARQQSHDQAHGDSGGHWVTIDHRHVFIQESSGSRYQHAQQKAALANKQKRKEIAEIAKEYSRSTAWAFDKKER